VEISIRQTVSAKFPLLCSPNHSRAAANNILSRRTAPRLKRTRAFTRVSSAELQDSRVRKPLAFGSKGQSNGNSEPTYDVGPIDSWKKHRECSFGIPDSHSRNIKAATRRGRLKRVGRALNGLAFSRKIPLFHRRSFPEGPPRDEHHLAARCATLQFSAVHRSAREFRVGVGADLRSSPDLEARAGRKTNCGKTIRVTERRGHETSGRAGDVGEEGREGEALAKKGGMEVTIKTERRRDCPGVSSRLEARVHRQLLRETRTCPAGQECCHNSGRIRANNVVTCQPRNDVPPRATRASLFNDRTRAAQSSLRPLPKADAKKSSRVASGLTQPRCRRSR